jgi:hypothetical protein
VALADDVVVVRLALLDELLLVALVDAIIGAMEALAEVDVIEARLLRRLVVSFETEVVDATTGARVAIADDEVVETILLIAEVLDIVVDPSIGAKVALALVVVMEGLLVNAIIGTLVWPDVVVEVEVVERKLELVYLSIAERFSLLFDLIVVTEVRVTVNICTVAVEVAITLLAEVLTEVLLSMEITARLLPLVGTSGAETGSFEEVEFAKGQEFVL